MKDSGKEIIGLAKSSAKEALKDERTLSKLESELAGILVSLQNNPKWDKYIAKRWEGFSPEQKEKIYKEGRPTKQMMINAALLNNPGAIYLIKGREFLEAPMWRWLVQAGLVDKPESVTEQQVLEDLKKDGKVFEKLSYVAEAIIAIFAPESIPELGTAKTIVLQIMAVRQGIAEKTRGMNVVEEDDSEAVAA